MSLLITILCFFIQLITNILFAIKNICSLKGVFKYVSAGRTKSVSGPDVASGRSLEIPVLEDNDYSDNNDEDDIDAVDDLLSHVTVKVKIYI